MIARAVARKEDHVERSRSVSFSAARRSSRSKKTNRTCCERSKAGIRDKDSRLRQHDVSFLLYCLIDHLVDSFFPILEEISVHLDGIETAVLEPTQRSVLPDIYRFRRDLSLLRRVAWPMRELIFKLHRESHVCLSETTATYLRDVYDHLVQVQDLLETYREFADSLDPDLYVAGLQSHERHHEDADDRLDHLRAVDVSGGRVRHEHADSRSERPGPIRCSGSSVSPSQAACSTCSAAAAGSDYERFVHDPHRTLVCCFAGPGPYHNGLLGPRGTGHLAGAASVRRRGSTCGVSVYSFCQTQVGSLRKDSGCGRSHTRGQHTNRQTFMSTSGTPMTACSLRSGTTGAIAPLGHTSVHWLHDSQQ